MTEQVSQVSTDSFLWYNVKGWDEYGLAVPNWSDDTQSKNETIRNIVESVGRNLQSMMFREDSMLRTPPSVNVIIDIHKLCTRARSILSSRAVPPGVEQDEPKHTRPAPQDFLVFPTPYFKVRNSWMRQYCGLALTALTEAIQHTENFKNTEITTAFADDVGKWIHRIYSMMSIELLRVPVPANDPLNQDPSNPKNSKFTLTEEMIRGYNPASWFSSTEMIDTVPPFSSRPTEDTLEVLTNGLAISQLPRLAVYPSGGPAITPTSNQQINVNSTGESFTPGRV
jgi:hypothetical protein